MAAIITDVTLLARQITETEARLAAIEEERLRLTRDNASLRQENEIIRGELARSREAVQAREIRQQHAGKSQPVVSGQKGPAPRAALPSQSGLPHKADPVPDTVEASTKVYSIR